MESIKPERFEAAYSKLLAIGNECVRAINTQHGCDFIVLVGKLPSKGWPRGKCIGSDSRGKFYSYKASHLLAKIVSLGVMTLETSMADVSNGLTGKYEGENKSKPIYSAESMHIAPINGE